MTAIQLLACSGMITGMFLLFGLRPAEFTESLFAYLMRPGRSIREAIKESSGRKKTGILRRAPGGTGSFGDDRERRQVFPGMCVSFGTVLFGWFFGYSIREFLSCSGDGCGISVSPILVCKADSQPL